ncbi:MAG: hypothetical protein L0Z62_23970, partial [Gemmataceae bacterium]|nr:hypothetical protein [Gemmataceae bacterium]
DIRQYGAIRSVMGALADFANDDDGHLRQFVQTALTTDPGEAPLRSAARNLALSNPITSVIYSVATLFGSKNRTQRDRNSSQIVCVVNVVSSVSGTLEAMDQSVSRIQDRSAGASDSLRSLFSDFTAVSGQRITWEEYIALVNGGRGGELSARMHTRLAAGLGQSRRGAQQLADGQGRFADTVTQRLQRVALALEAREAVVRDVAALLGQVRRLLSQLDGINCSQAPQVNDSVKGRVRAALEELNKTSVLFTNNYLARLPSAQDRSRYARAVALELH